MKRYGKWENWIKLVLLALGSRNHNPFNLQRVPQIQQRDAPDSSKAGAEDEIASKEKLEKSEEIVPLSIANQSPTIHIQELGFALTSGILS
jgi:hypothetical protein